MPPSTPPPSPEIDPAVRELLAAAGVGPVEVVATLRPPRSGTWRRDQARHAADRIVDDTTAAAHEDPERVVVMANIGVVVVRASPAYIGHLMRHELLGTLTTNRTRPG